jgi:hypothetical protein
VDVDFVADGKRERKRSVLLRVVVVCHLVWVDVDFAAKGKRAKKKTKCASEGWSFATSYA